MKVTVNGIAINYEVAGAAGASPVVLHHPLATNLATWDDLTRALTPRYRVVRFDARGHGQSDAPRGPYRFETLAADVVALMDHLAIDKARFVGLSMGGMVGQYLGLMHPDRFHSLCLVSTASRMPPETHALWAQRIRDAGALGMAALVEGALARWLSPAALAGNPALVARLTAMIEKTPADGYVGWCHAIRGLDITDRLEAVRLPTQVIVGALDPATPPAAAEAIRREIAGATLIVMPGVSHMLQLEEPEAFHGHVLPFLAAHGA